MDISIDINYELEDFQTVYELEFMSLVMSEVRMAVIFE